MVTKAAASLKKSTYKLDGDPYTDNYGFTEIIIK
jgi:hypothetical protein